ncbi:MAG: hypothetical protein COV99_11800 [Bacteroidetes bacterium CG12_big_fil_rev_8_21_14_0_65_60_17]|nr:MAG: hypothetical protein COV99_11800 [Bacteroidetes bacterium CG12_big_fil_rev_8_21_14_0_65_60_17]
MDLIGRSEELLLITIWRLQDDAYGVRILETMNRATGRDWSLGSIYAPLHRLQRKGLVRITEGAPNPERGGRPTVLYHLTPKGKKALIDVKTVHDTVWTGIPELKPA